MNKKNKENVASETFTLRLTPTERETLNALADSTGVPASAVIKRLIIEAAAAHNTLEDDYRARGLAAIMRARLDIHTRTKGGKVDINKIYTPDEWGCYVIPCEGASLTLKQNIYCYYERGKDYPVVLTVEQE